MEEEYVKYREALDLKNIGFDEPCMSVFRGKSPYYDKMISGYESDILSNTELSRNSDFDAHFEVNKTNPNWWLTRPTYRQVFKWFRDNYGLVSVIKPVYFSEHDKRTGSFVVMIFDMKDVQHKPKEINFDDVGYKIDYIEDEEDFEKYFRIYEEAEIACLREFIRRTARIKNIKIAQH